jgi:hypothetical protein
MTETQGSPAIDGALIEVRDALVGQAEAAGLRARDIAGGPYPLMIPLAPQFQAAYGGPELQVPLASFAGNEFAGASYSMFRVPPNGGEHLMLVSVVRPMLHVHAPLLYLELLRPMAGVPGLFIFELYNPAGSDLDRFAVSMTPAIERARAAVAPHADPKGMAHLTSFMDPYKSQHRIELAAEPGALEDFFLAAAVAAKELISSYFTAVAHAPREPTLASAHEAGLREFTQLIWREDIALKLGRLVFQDRLLDYWADGVWSVPGEWFADVEPTPLAMGALGPS